MKTKTYLGDAVYVEDEGYHVILTVEYGQGPEHTIYLEPKVLTAFFLWESSRRERHKRLFENHKKGIPHERTEGTGPAPETSTAGTRTDVDV